VKELKNGTLQLSMTVGSLVQVVPWVLSYGALAKVIKPKELKIQIKEIIYYLSKQYGITN